MPLFSVKFEIRKRVRRGCNPLNCLRLLNRRINCSRFSTACSTAHGNGAEGLLGDYVGRLDDWQWPEQDNAVGHSES